MAIGALTDKWLGRFANGWTFLSPIVPGTVGALVSGSLASTATWLNQWGWFGWWCAVLMGFLVASAAWAAVNVAKERLAVRRTMEKWAAKVADSVNPLDDAFHQKRLSLSDLANPVTRKIENKKFTNCELIGPANIFLLKDLRISNVTFIDCDMCPTKDEVALHNVIALESCEIYGGIMAKATVFLHPKTLAIIERSGLGAYYPTLTGNPTIDARKPPGSQQ